MLVMNGVRVITFAQATAELKSHGSGYWNKNPQIRL